MGYISQDPLEKGVIAMRQLFLATRTRRAALPVVREGVEQGQWDRVEAGVAATAEALEAFAGEVEKASAALAGATVE